MDHLHSIYQLISSTIFFVAYSPAVETYEIPELPVDDTTMKVNPARSENVITSSNPAYGHFRISRQTKEDDRKKQGTIRYIRL